METIYSIVTSGLIAGIVSTIVSYIISIRLKKLDFKNDYYKELLKRRLNAYQFIDSQISVLKGVVLDESDKQPYHMIFSYGEAQFFDYQKNLLIAINSSLWIDRETTKALENLNELFYNLNIKANGLSDQQLVELGKTYYKQISDLRFELENETKRGLYNLHDMKRAFKPNKKNNIKRIRNL